MKKQKEIAGDCWSWDGKMLTYKINGWYSDYARCICGHTIPAHCIPIILHLSDKHGFPHNVKLPKRITVKYVELEEKLNGLFES